MMMWMSAAAATAATAAAVAAATVAVAARCLQREALAGCFESPVYKMQGSADWAESRQGGRRRRRYRGLQSQSHMKRVCRKKEQVSGPEDKLSHSYEAKHGQTPDSPQIWSISPTKSSKHQAWR